MIKNRIFYTCAFSLSLAVIFISGCAYLTHLDEVIFLKGLENNQKQMQAELAKEEKLYNKLKADIDNRRLKKLTQKRTIIHLYGEAVLCKPAEGANSFKESCIYRKPTGGMFGEIILLNLDAQDRLYSWEIQDSGK